MTFVVNAMVMLETESVVLIYRVCSIETVIMHFFNKEAISRT